MFSPYSLKCLIKTRNEKRNCLVGDNNYFGKLSEKRVQELVFCYEFLKP